MVNNSRMSSQKYTVLLLPIAMNVEETGTKSIIRFKLLEAGAWFSAKLGYHVYECRSHEQIPIIELRLAGRQTLPLVSIFVCGSCRRVKG